MRAPLINALSAAVIMGLAGVVAAVAITWSVAILAPTASPSQFLGKVLPIRAPRAARAELAFARGDLVTAAKESQAELSISPLFQDAWMRLAAIDLAHHGRLTQSGLAALDHAYDAQPYDLDPNSVRLRLALRRYGDLTPSVRGSVDEELAVWAQTPVLRAALRQLPPTSVDQGGQQALTAALNIGTTPTISAAP